MRLTPVNYHSLKAAQEYLSVSQYKDFRGSMGMRGCEARALAKISGDWTEEPSPAMIVSSYVDAHFSGTLDIFRAKNHKIVTRQDGETKAIFRRAEEIINRIESDDYFMRFMSGKKQRIFTAVLFGAKWKIMVDSFLPDTAAVDLKVMRDLRKAFWVKDYGYVSFVEFYGYDIQGAIYQKVIELNGRGRLPFFIAGASKDEEPDIEIIGIDDRTLSDTLREVEGNIPRILDLKAGKVEPDRCGVCPYCRSTKILTRPIHFSELIGQIYGGN